MTRALHRFFFDPFPIEPLALCRVVLGLALFALYATRALEFDVLLSSDGLSHHMGYASAWPPAGWTPWLLGAVLCAAAAFTLGLLTPFAGFVLVLCHLHFNQLVRLEWGWRDLVHALVMYVAISGAGGAYSLDSARRRRRFGVAPTRYVTAWPARLVQVHLTAIYIAASYHRLDDPGWLRGEMVFEALTMSLWTRFPGIDFAPYRGLLEIACWWAWAVELLAPIGLWVRHLRIREVMVLNLALLHTVLALSAPLGIWQPMMLAALTCFAPVQWSRWVLEAPCRLRRAPGPSGR